MHFSNAFISAFLNFYYLEQYNENVSLKRDRGLRIKIQNEIRVVAATNYVQISKNKGVSVHMQ